LAFAPPIVNVGPAARQDRRRRSTPRPFSARKVVAPMTDQPASEPRRPTPGELRAFRPDQALLWYDYADLWLRGPLGRVLDFGCACGAYLRRLAGQAVELHGVDLDPERVAAAGAQPGITARTVSPDGPVPYPDETFDTVVILEVIEHVPDERRLLKELARVLKPGGRLLLTTPHRGWLTFLDPGNFKFLMPRLHRFIHTRLLRQRDYYEKRFGDARRRLGMYGDLDASDPWHRHYSGRDLCALAPPELRLEAWAAYYPGFRALWSLQLAVKVLTCGLVPRLPPPFPALHRWLSHRESRGGDQLVALFRKKPQS